MIKSVVEANADKTVSRDGVAHVEFPEQSHDPAQQIRRHTLWRGLYPRSAPAPHAPVTTTAAEASSSPPKADAPVSSAPSLALSLLPTPGRSSASAAAASVHTAATAAVTPSGAAASPLLSTTAGNKRPRTTADGSSQADDDILQGVDPETLKAQHALTLFTSSGSHARLAAEKKSYVEPPRWKLSKVLLGHEGWVWSAAVDPTNSWCATGSFDSVIKVWDLSTGVFKLNLVGHKAGVRSIALSQHSPYLFSGSDDHSVKCWDLERNEAIRDFFGHKSGVYAVAVHPTLDNIVISAGRDKSVRVWDVRSRAIVHTLVGHKDSVLCVATHDVDPQVISGGGDGFIYLWDLAAGKAMKCLTRHKKPVRGITMSPGGDQLISCGADDIRVWKLATGEYLGRASTIESSVLSASLGMATPEEYSYRWSCCAMSRRGVMAVGSQDGHLAFYDWKRPQPPSGPIDYAPYHFSKTKSIPGTQPGEGGLNAVTFDTSGTRMITAESDKSVKLWRLRVPDESN